MIPQLRCPLCGASLSAGVTCSKPIRVDAVVPAHCFRCHWEAIHVAEGTFTGPILPDPYAQPVEEPRNPNPGKPLDDPKAHKPFWYTLK